MPATDRRYCVVGIYWANNPTTPEFLAVEGKIVVFDTVQCAREVIPSLAPGRVEYWDVTQEICAFSPLSRQSFNRIAIFTGYDPYDVPSGFRSKGVWSEGEGRPWRRHVYWRHVIEILTAWGDRLAIQDEETNGDRISLSQR